MKDIFFKALDLSERDERAALIAQSCGADDELRRQLEAMLRARRFSTLPRSNPLLCRGGGGDAPHPHRQRPQEEKRKTRRRVAWHDNVEVPAKPLDNLQAIDEALILLAQEDAEAALLVKLRFYAGLSVDEAADTMGLARATAYRTGTYAKAWLRTKLAEDVDS